MIPRIIHYCWLSGDAVPENLRKCTDSWKEKLPGYEFMLWDFKRFDKNNSPWVRRAFEEKKYAFAADVIRLFAVYHYGGIYLDMDIEVIKPFDGLLRNETMIAYEDNRTRRIEAGCFGAEKGHRFIKACLDYFNGREFSTKIIEEGYTLPRIMKKVCDSGGSFADIKFYTQDYFTAKRFRTGIIKTTGNTYTIHHFAGTWFSEEEKAGHERAKKIAAFFGDNIFSVFVVLCGAAAARIKKYGLWRALKYWTCFKA
jgi:mannosyltransferase OCH1-like enzyme